MEADDRLLDIAFDVNSVALAPERLREIIVIDKADVRV